MQNAFGECHFCSNGNVFQYIVSDEASADNTYHSTEESKGRSVMALIEDNRLMFL